MAVSSGGATEGTVEQKEYKHLNNTHFRPYDTHTQHRPGIIQHMQLTTCSRSHIGTLILTVSCLCDHYGGFCPCNYDIMYAHQSKRRGKNETIHVDEP